MRKCDFNKAALQEAFDVINHNILLKKNVFDWIFFSISYMVWIVTL